MNSLDLITDMINGEAWKKQMDEQRELTERQLKTNRML